MPKKKSKKQKEEEKKKAEEEKLRLDEEQRVRDEEARKKREEEERVRRELEEKIKQEELARLQEEQSKVVERSNTVARLTTESEEKKEEGDEWDKHIGGDPLPDPEDERDLTAFLTLWEEGRDKNIKECLENCLVAELVVRKLRSLQFEAMSEFREDNIEWGYDYIHRLKAMGRHKFDQITQNVMENIEVHLLYTEEEKKKMTGKKIETIREYFTIEGENKYFKVGIRGNHAKMNGTEMFKHEKLGISNEVPRIFCNQFNLQRSIWIANDETAHEKSPYFAVGGVLNIEIFPLPEIPKKHRNWIIRNIQDMDDTLQKKNFPDTGGNMEPITIAFTIPENVWIDEGREDVEVGWWNEESKEWQLDNLEEVKINKTTREVSFKTIRLAPFAYLQPRGTDFPYVSWKLRGIEPDVALLDIQTKRINLSFEIGADYGKLIEQKEPELQRLVDQELSPGILLKELIDSGILLIPVDDDFELAGLALKDKDAEERAIWDVVTSVNAYAFRSAKWNHNPSLKDNIVVKIRENLEYDREFFEDYEPDWRYIMWWSNKCSLVDCVDTDEDFERKVNITEGNETHALLSLTLVNNATEEALERCNTFTHIRFIQTLKKFMRILRLLSFS